MTTNDVESLREDLRSVRQQLATIEDLQRQTNGRVSNLELWRARWEGAAATSRVVWLLAGGAITAVLIELIKVKL